MATDQTCAARETAPTGALAAFCERLHDATGIDAPWAWRDLGDDDRAEFAARVREALDGHVAGLCAELLDRAAAKVLARPGRPPGDRIGDAVADVLRATAMDLRADAGASGEAVPPLLELPGKAFLVAPDIGRAMADLQPLAARRGAQLGASRMRVALHLADDGRWFAEVTEGRDETDVFGEWSADPMAAVATLRAELEQVLRAAE